jgi:uncharacterized protein
VAPQEQFVVLLADLENGPQRTSYIVEKPWFDWALKATEASASEKPGRLELEVIKSAEEVLVRGSIEVEVTLPCARSLAPFTLALKPEVSLTLRREAEPERLIARSKRARLEKEGAPRAKSAKAKGWAGDPELSPAEAGQDVFAGERIVLDPFLREFVVLELPMFPVAEGLPLPAIDARPSGPKPEAGASEPLDPRLAPLAELKRRLKAQENKE